MIRHWNPYQGQTTARGHQPLPLPTASVLQHKVEWSERIADPLARQLQRPAARIQAVFTLNNKTTESPIKVHTGTSAAIAFTNITFLLQRPFCNSYSTSPSERLSGSLHNNHHESARHGDKPHLAQQTASGPQNTIEIEDSQKIFPRNSASCWLPKGSMRTQSAAIETSMKWQRIAGSGPYVLGLFRAAI